MECSGTMQEISAGRSKKKRLELLSLDMKRWGSMGLGPRHLQSRFWLAVVLVFLEEFNEVETNYFAVPPGANGCQWTEETLLGLP